MKKKHLSTLLALGVALIFILSGCVMLKGLRGEKFETFELTFGTEKLTINLPDALPSMSEAVLAGEQCFNADICRQRFCVTKDIGHDHVDFVFIGNDVIALVWIKSNEMDRDKRFLAWIYVEGKPMSASIEAINELIRKHSPNE